MPTIRKVTAVEFEECEPPPALAPEAAEMLLRQLADRSGISRMHYERSAAAWFARVYARGQTIGRSFADSIYGSPVRALTAAVAWRDATRRQFAAPGRQVSPPRVVRVDRWGQHGYYAYRHRRERRYFSDGAHGGPEGSRNAAEHWSQQPLSENTGRHK